MSAPKCILQCQLAQCSNQDRRSRTPHGPAYLCCLFCCVVTVGHLEVVLRLCEGSWQACPRAEENMRSSRPGGRNSGKMSCEMGSLLVVLGTLGGGLTEEFTNAMPRTIHAMRRKDEVVVPLTAEKPTNRAKSNLHAPGEEEELEQRVLYQSSARCPGHCSGREANTKCPKCSEAKKRNKGIICLPCPCHFLAIETY